MPCWLDLKDLKES